MIAELGHFSLILALCLALAQAVVPLLGAAFNNRLWMTTARSTAGGQFVFAAISFICLTLLFINDDFSVRYVADNSNSLLPIYYKISAVWAAHEGSLLLWVLILAAWSLAVALFSRTLPLDMVARVLGVLGLVAIGFYLFVLFTSNPFARLLPVSPPDGSDLNPLLQDGGLIIHPPILYMGYVGFSVAFAFALAALMGGRMDAAWARWARPWTNAAWVFLTLGIALGSWWAYYELGWGGWWFWDPVENASFMPWLAGTALMHSLAVAEKRGLFRSWTLLLAILAFSLSLLGTFLVRSGVLTSVHAFAADPARGIFILMFLAVVIGGSLLLFALRGSVVARGASFDWCSREAFLLGNNLLLIIAMAIILLGTLYPLLADMAGWGKISVGPPYFNLFFVPLALMLGLLMAPGAVVRWKTHKVGTLTRRALLTSTSSLILAAVVLVVSPVAVKVMPWLALSTAFWVGFWCFGDWWEKSAFERGRWAGARRLRGSYYGMQCAHLGVAVAIVGVALTSYYSQEHDIRLAPGESMSIGPYQFAFHGVRDVPGPNYIARRGRIEVFRDNLSLLELRPEKRHYTVGGQVMTEADIDGGFLRDIYVALGEDLESDGAWSLRIYVKPFVRWIWLGALLMALGGVVAALDKRYRRLKRASLDPERLSQGAALGAD